jgi:opacity protein-like surface antigen
MLLLVWRLVRELPNSEPSDRGESKMRKILVLTVFTLLFASTSFAQSSDSVHVEVLVGYANLQAEGLPNRDQQNTFSDRFFGDRTGLHGVIAEATVYLPSGFGLTGDFSFNKRTRNFTGGVNSGRGSLENQVFNFLAGPQYKWRRADSHLEPFGHALFGVARTRFRASNTQTVGSTTTTTSFTTTSTDFAMGLGGGLDVRVNNRFAIRTIQFDYNPVFFRSRSIDALSSVGAIQPFRLENQRQDNLRFGFGVVVR